VSVPYSALSTTSANQEIDSCYCDQRRLSGLSARKRQGFRRAEVLSKLIIIKQSGKPLCQRSRLGNTPRRMAGHARPLQAVGIPSSVSTTTSAKLKWVRTAWAAANRCERGGSCRCLEDHVGSGSALSRNAKLNWARVPAERRHVDRGVDSRDIDHVHLRLN
jgi:hypothetical protein